MTDKRYTPEGLPVVKQEIFEVFEREVGKYYAILNESISERMLKENPALIEALKKIASSERFSERKTFLFIGGGIIAYEILRRQGEAYILEKTWEEKYEE